MSNFKSNRIFAVAIICLKQISFVIISYDNTYTCLLHRPNNRNHIEQDYIRKVYKISLTMRLISLLRCEIRLYIKSNFNH